MDRAGQDRNHQVRRAVPDRVATLDHQALQAQVATPGRPDLQAAQNPAAPQVPRAQAVLARQDQADPQAHPAFLEHLATLDRAAHLGNLDQADLQDRVDRDRSH